MDKAECLQDFDAAQDLGSVPTVGRALNRMEQQITAVERAAREFNEVPTS